MGEYVHGATGSHVQDFQNAILAHNPALLPKWGADGSLGNESWTAVEVIADQELDEEQPIPDAIVKAILAVSTGKSKQTRLPAGIKFHDITTRHDGVHRKGARPWGQVTSIVLHQTGCMLPNRPGGWTTLRAHIGILRTTQPTIVLCNPLNSYMWHANSFNRHSIGIEINGNFCGIEGDEKTWWKKGGGESIKEAIEYKTKAKEGEKRPTHRTIVRPWSVTDSQIVATRECIRWIMAEVSRHGGNITHIFAHRQASKNRIADPGSKVWRECGVWAQDNLGLSDGGPGFKQGSGYVIPAVWTPQPGYESAKYFR